MKITSSTSSNDDYEVTLGFASVLENLTDDTTPQLGGDLDLNSSDITGTGNVNITGTVTATNVSVGGTTFSTINENVSNLVTLSGVSANAANLGTFTGTTISDNVTIKAAIQELETGLDNVSGGNNCHNSRYTQELTLTLTTSSTLLLITTLLRHRKISEQIAVLHITHQPTN